MMALPPRLTSGRFIIVRIKESFDGYRVNASINGGEDVDEIERDALYR